jgi:hypothetical protein
MRDQELRGRLVQALRECGITTNPQKLADAICALVNHKVEKSEGRHHARFHKAPADLEPFLNHSSTHMGPKP